MPFEIVRNDITNMCVDAIVNSANPRPVVGLGTDSSIHEKAGPELLAARQKIGSIPMGQAAITPAFRLHAKYVIHTVGPVWDGGSYGEEALLRNCYDQSLKLALEHDCKSIAFPLIATNNYGFPKAYLHMKSYLDKILTTDDPDLEVMIEKYQEVIKIGTVLRSELKKAEETLIPYQKYLEQ